jgi:hypothetical protein
VSPDYLKTTYREKLAAHLAQVKRAAAGLGATQVLLVTDEPLDKPLRAFLGFRSRG